MKVMIGNDIRLKIQLGYADGTKANIFNARAFFINSTLKEKIEKEYKKKLRFFGRFPIEPFTNEFDPSAYNINSTGYARYNVPVFNRYNGFGVYPDWKNCFPIKDVDITKYEGKVIKTSDSEVIIVDFPANAQKFEGNYELVITAEIYDSGYETHSRIVTANYENLFELVSNSRDADVDSAVQIEINNSSDSQQKQDIYLVSGSYTDNDIKLVRNDGRQIHVDVSPITGWYEGD